MSFLCLKVRDQSGQNLHHFRMNILIPIAFSYLLQIVTPSSLMLRFWDILTFFGCASSPPHHRKVNVLNNRIDLMGKSYPSFKDRKVTGRYLG